ncbi:hypothetical protein LUW77_27600 [Streptomyces radiopugnans]|nr:hypothetical protein LUW77_27600 [Streptomyces radiopugnans]
MSGCTAPGTGGVQRGRRHRVPRPKQDRQVKIRGHRIELAETEAALSSHPAVASAHALVDGDGPLDRRLLAYARLATGARSVPDCGAERLLAAASARGDAAVRDVDPAELSEFMRRLDRAGLLAMLHAFNRQGLFRSPGDRHTVPEVLEATAAAPCHHRLVRRWLRSLTEAGLLTRHGDAYAAAGPVSGEDLDAAWREVDALQREEWYRADLIGYFRTCAERLPELLRDEIDPLPLLFPEGGLDLSYAAYRDNVLSRYVNHAVVGLVRELAAAHEGPLRLLEVGAGVGGTSTVLVPEIADTNVRYLFTDVSQFFLGEARRRFGDRVDYGLFDINGDAREQGRLPELAGRGAVRQRPAQRPARGHRPGAAARTAGSRGVAGLHRDHAGERADHDLDGVHDARQGSGQVGLRGPAPGAGPDLPRLRAVAAPAPGGARTPSWNCRTPTA